MSRYLTAAEVSRELGVSLVGAKDYLRELGLSASDSSTVEWGAFLRWRDTRGTRGWVYYAQADGIPLIKIGWTSNLAKRLKGLRAQCPAHVRYLGKHRGTILTEKAQHRRFAPSHHGEWFPETVTLLQFIAGLA